MFCSSTCVTILLHYMCTGIPGLNIFTLKIQYASICCIRSVSLKIDLWSIPLLSPSHPFFLKINIVNAVFLFRSFWLIFQNKALAVCFEASSCQIFPFMTHRFQNRYSRIDCASNHSTDAEPRRIFVQRETSEWRGKIARREILIAWFIQHIRQ